MHAEILELSLNYGIRKTSYWNGRKRTIDMINVHKMTANVPNDENALNLFFTAAKNAQEC